MIAALYVETGGVYYGLEDVDPWDETRDARLYDGPWPVVAHPPCSSWCQLASVNEARYGHPIGADGGCFAAALAAVRRWGGVLEHPAYTIAWEHYWLTPPLPGGGWQRTFDGAWVCEVSQAAYGHEARKLTWLYAIVDDPPELDWSRPEPRAIVSYASKGFRPELPRISKKRASATPLLFRDALLDIARTATRVAA